MGWRGLILRTLAVALLAAGPAHAQELPEGQSEADYQAWLTANPHVSGQILSFEAWQDAAGVRGALPNWQLLRTASMWRECGGAPFEIPPFQLWPGLTRTLRFIRDHVKPALGDVEAVSGYRNPTLNQCARGSDRSAHLDYFALDMIPRPALERRELFRRLCAIHASHGRGSGVGLGFYTFQRFHIDTRSFRRWGSAGPRGNESPCALIERGQDPDPNPIAYAQPRVPTPRPAPPPARPLQPRPSGPPGLDTILALEAALAPPPANNRRARPARVRDLVCSAIVAGRVSCNYRIDRCARNDPGRRGGYCLRTRTLRFGADGRWALDAAPAHILPPGQSPNPIG